MVPLYHWGSSKEYGSDNFQSEEGRPKQKSSRRREEPELKYTCGEAGETKSEITSKADTESENEAKGVTSEWLKVS